MDFGNILTNKKSEYKKSNNDIISNEDNFKFSTTKNEQFSFDMSVIVELMINYNNMDCININKQDEIYLLKQNKDYLEKLFNDVIEDYKDAIYRENTYNKASEEYKDYTNCLYFFISLKERMLSLKELNTHFFTKEKTQSFINRY